MKSKKKKTNFLQLLTGLFLFCHFIVLAALVFSLMAGVIPTDKVWVFSFFGLIYVPLYIVNIGFTALWAFMRRKYWMLSVIPLVIGFMIFRGHFNIRFSNSYAQASGDIKVMQFNVRGFQPIEGMSHNAFMQKTFAIIKNEIPDIICFQDYNLPVKGKFGVEGLQKQLGLPYSSSRNYSVYNDNVSVSGVGILSRYPIIESQPIAIDSGYTCVSSDILYRNKLIRVISIHLQSYALYSDEKVILNAPGSFPTSINHG